VRPTGTSDVLLDLPGLALAGGHAYSLVALGLAGGAPPLAALLLTDLTPAPTTQPAAAATAPAVPPPAAPPPPPAAPPAAGAAQAVRIFDFGYQPATLQVKVGETVRWTNTGGETHTATADNAFDSGPLSTGRDFSFTFTRAGTFNYYCRPHRSIMRAQIVVVP